MECRAGVHFLIADLKASDLTYWDTEKRAFILEPGRINKNSKILYIIQNHDKCQFFVLSCAGLITCEAIFQQEIYY